MPIFFDQTDPTDQLNRQAQVIDQLLAAGSLSLLILAINDFTKATPASILAAWAKRTLTGITLDQLQKLLANQAATNKDVSALYAAGIATVDPNVLAAVKYDRALVSGIVAMKLLYAAITGASDAVTGAWVQTVASGPGRSGLAASDVANLLSILKGSVNVFAADQIVDATPAAAIAVNAVTLQPAQPVVVIPQQPSPPIQSPGQQRASL